MYFIILRTEGQLFCLAKHCSTENQHPQSSRELWLWMSQPVIRMRFTINRQELKDRHNDTINYHEVTHDSIPETNFTYLIIQ